MSFEVRYAASARRDLRNIYEYIAYDILVPETAARQAQLIMKPKTQSILSVSFAVEGILESSLKKQ